MTSGVYQFNFADCHHYIGSSNNIARRVKEHIYLLVRNIHYNAFFQRVFNKYGDPKITNLVICSPEHCILYEQVCMDAFKPDLNLSLTAGKIEMTEAVVEKIGNFQRLRAKTPEGKAQIAESLAAAREAIVGKPRPQEWCDNLSVALTGRLLGYKHTEQARTNMVASSQKRVSTGAGKAQLEEAVRLSSEKSKGVPLSIEHRGKIGLSQKGKPKDTSAANSPESIAKRAESHRGMKYKKRRTS